MEEKNDLDRIIKEDDLDVLIDFVEYLLKERRYSFFTAKNYHDDVEDFVNYLSSNKLKYMDASVPMVRAYMLELTLRGQKKVTIRRKMSSLTQFYDFLLSREKAFKNPFELVFKPKVDKRLPDFLSPVEVKELFEANRQRNDELVFRDQAMLELLYSSGLRVSELANLTLQNVNLKQRYVRILGKGKKERIVPFTNQCQESIEKYINETRQILLLRNKNNEITNKLFLNNQGQDLTTRGVEYILSSIEKKTGVFLKLHPHKLRHTFATTLLNNGADLRTIQELMGHSSVGTTQIYTHVTYNNMKKTYDNIFPRAKKLDEEDK